MSGVTGRDEDTIRQALNATYAADEGTCSYLLPDDARLSALKALDRLSRPRPSRTAVHALHLTTRPSAPESAGGTPNEPGQTTPDDLGDGGAVVGTAAPDISQLAPSYFAASSEVAGEAYWLIHFEDAALALARSAEDVDENIMGNGLAHRRDRLRWDIGAVRQLVERNRAERLGGTPQTAKRSAPEPDSRDDDAVAYVRSRLLHAGYVEGGGAIDSFDRLVARAEAAERERDEALGRRLPTYQHEWVSAIINENNQRGARLGRLEEALRGLTDVAEQYFNTGRGDLDGWIAAARAALVGGTPPGETQTDSGDGASAVVVEVDQPSDQGEPR